MELYIFLFRYFGNFSYFLLFLTILFFFNLIHILNKYYKPKNINAYIIYYYI